MVNTCWHDVTMWHVTCQLTSVVSVYQWAFILGVPRFCRLAFIWFGFDWLPCCVRQTCTAAYLFLIVDGLRLELLLYQAHWCLHCPRQMTMLPPIVDDNSMFVSYQGIFRMTTSFITTTPGFCHKLTQLKKLGIKLHPLPLLVGTTIKQFLQIFKNWLRVSERWVLTCLLRNSVFNFLLTFYELVRVESQLAF